MIAPTLLGSRLLAARIARGYTQQTLSRTATVSQAQISKLERGAISDPGVATLGLLAGALQLSIGSLLGSNSEFDQALLNNTQQGTLVGMSQLNQAAVYAPAWHGHITTNTAVLGDPKYTAPVVLQQLARAQQLECPFVSVAMHTVPVAWPQSVVYRPGENATVDLISLSPQEPVVERKSVVQQFLGATFNAKASQASTLANALDRLYDSALETVPTLHRLYTIIEEGTLANRGFWLQSLERFLDGGDLAGILATDKPSPQPSVTEQPVQFWDCSGLSDTYFRNQLQLLCVHNTARAQLLTSAQPLVLHVQLVESDTALNSAARLATWISMSHKHNMAFLVEGSVKETIMPRVLSSCEAVALTPALEEHVATMAATFDLNQRDQQRLLKYSNTELLYLTGEDRGWTRLVQEDGEEDFLSLATGELALAS
jgi:transcriptional regulator with XRE-family HTH domain